MSWYIDANAKVHAQVYDGQSETWRVEEVTVADALDAYSDEGCPAPADVQEVKHGAWIKEHNYGDTWYHTCNQCHMEQLVNYYDEYCANCGAKMDGKESRE